MNAETLRQEMAVVGERLIESQQAELKLSKRYGGQRDAELLEQWKAARRAVERMAEEYAQAIRRYHDAVESQFLTERPTPSASSSSADPALP